MGQAIPRQHPAVVLRSHYNQLRALLAALMLAVAGLTVAVVIVANDSDQVSSTSAARPIESINYGDFNPATGRPDRAQQPGIRYDGGPEEGTSGALSAGASSKAAPGLRYDGGSADALSSLTPKERTRVEAISALSPAQIAAAFGHGTAVDAGIRYDGGPEEGTAGVTQSQPRVAQQQAFPGLPTGTTGDDAHGPLPPAAPAKDYGMNGSTGDFATEPEAKAGSRPDGGPEEGSHLSGPRP